MTTLFSVLLLLPWVYVSSGRAGANWQNLYANRIRTLLFRPVSAAGRLLPRQAPEWVAPAVCGALLLLARLLLGVAVGGGFPDGRGLPPADLRLCGGVIALRARDGAPIALLALQLGSFAFLLGRLALLRLLLVWRLGEGDGGAPVEFLGISAWPAARPGAGAARNAAGAAALLLAGAALCCAGAGVGFSPGPVVKLALGAAADTLLLVRALLFAFCILSFANAFSRPPAWSARADWASFAAMAASDWLDAFDRAVFGRPIVFGAVGLGPLILFFVTGALHALLVGALM